MLPEQCGGTGAQMGAGVRASLDEVLRKFLPSGVLCTAILPSAGEHKDCG